jgi:hypothetical protein
VEQTGAEHFAMQMLKAMATEFVLVKLTLFRWATAIPARTRLQLLQVRLRRSA